MSEVRIDAFAARHGLDPDVIDELRTLVAELTPHAALSTLVPADEDAAATPTPAQRYEDLEVLGAGGMGEVRRVRDRRLNRTVAMKALLAHHRTRPDALARFVEEAQATSQLQHPNIVPVYDMGFDSDGAPWFTMKEIRGTPLRALIAEVHAASGLHWAPGPSGWNLHRLIAALQQVCHAVGYAHARGVVHRDLKPDNVMVGEHGEVCVVDWGLAKVRGRPEPARPDDEPVITDRARSGRATLPGAVSGTPLYMAPEQARGEVDRVDERSDVYGLGAILYEILAGHPPVRPDRRRPTLQIAAAGDRTPLPDHPRLPAELVAICDRALDADPARRYASAAELAAEIGAWIEGARRRQRALEVVTQAQTHGAGAEALRALADRCDAEADALLTGIAPWEPQDRKVEGWTRQDEAAALRRRADLAEIAQEQCLHGALRLDPTLPEAHAALAAHYLARHAASERERDRDAQARAEALAVPHLQALPEGHPVRLDGLSTLSGEGALTLITDPPGAEVELYRFEEQDRRLVPVRLRALGPTPLVERPLPMGSYLCLIHHPDRAPVRYPVHIARRHHWDGVPPGEREPCPVWLPTPDALDDDCYVPPGWFATGGDPAAIDSLPPQRLWCDGFAMQRFPVTNEAFVAFLDDRVAAGREDDALRWAPRLRSSAPGAPGALIYGREGDRFVLVPDADGDVWDPRWPVLSVDWEAAVAYARWLAARTGRPWRLPSELEWAKAARGVDGRFFPWGDRLDPSWCCMRESHPARPTPAPVDTFPVDCSVYGVRGLAGNCRDWCADPWRVEGPLTPGQRVPPPTSPERAPGGRRATRGGHWGGVARLVRCEARGGGEPTDRLLYLGFRLVRSLHGGGSG